MNKQPTTNLSQWEQKGIQGLAPNKPIEQSENKPSDESQYLRLHGEIMQYGNMTVTCFIELAKRLKEMRDGKLYKAAGINSFEDYVEQQVGIKRAQAYKYITVCEKYSEDFVYSNRQIGVTKLALLAPLSEEDREQLLEEVDVENTSVAKLKEKIAALNSRVEELQADNTTQELQQKLDAMTTERDELAEKLDQVDDEHERLAHAIEEQNKLQAEKKRIAGELQKANAQLEELRNKPAKVETVTETVQVEVENPKTAKALEEAQKRIEELQAEQQALTKKLELANDETMLKFKSKFEDLQLIGKDIFSLLSVMDTTKAEKCKAALKAVLDGWDLS